MRWWLGRVETDGQFLCRDFAYDFELFTDASLSGWGAVCNGNETKGTWPAFFNPKHINVLEMYAVFFGLKSLIKVKNKNILLRVDNTTTMCYINRFGGCKSDLHEVAKAIWQWAENNNIGLSASYINTKHNIIADRLSRDKKDSSEFKLASNYFNKIINKFGTPKLDLFASHMTTQCQNFYSYKPDPFSSGVDAFSFYWTDGSYAFPPFNMILKCLNKIMQDKCDIIVVVPFWQTQPWYPIYKRLVISEIIMLGPKNSLLFDPYRNTYVSPNKKLKLMAAVLSGKYGKS